MITAIVKYQLPASIDRAACAAHFHKIAAGFRNVPGLHRKNFIIGEDGSAGGVYLWETREAAEKFYSGPWRAGIRERYGMDPEITYFETAAITDNAPAQPSVRVFEPLGGDLVGAQEGVQRARG